MRCLDFQKTSGWREWTSQGIDNGLELALKNELTFSSWQIGKGRLMKGSGGAACVKTQRHNQKSASKTCVCIYTRVRKGNSRRTRE